MDSNKLKVINDYKIKQLKIATLYGYMIQQGVMYTAGGSQYTFKKEIKIAGVSKLKAVQKRLLEKVAVGLAAIDVLKVINKDEPIEDIDIKVVLDNTDSNVIHQMLIDAGNFEYKYMNANDKLETIKAIIHNVKSVNVKIKFNDEYIYQLVKNQEEN